MSGTLIDEVDSPRCKVMGPSRTASRLAHGRRPAPPAAPPRARRCRRVAPTASRRRADRRCAGPANRRSPDDGLRPSGPADRDRRRPPDGRHPHVHGGISVTLVPITRRSSIAKTTASRSRVGGLVSNTGGWFVVRGTIDTNTEWARRLPYNCSRHAAVGPPSDPLEVVPRDRRVTGVNASRARCATPRSSRRRHLRWRAHGSRRV